MNKKILVSLAIASLVFAGCGKLPNPQELLDESMQNAFTVNSASFTGNMDLGIENVKDTNGSLKIDFMGKGEGLVNPPQKIDYEITMNADLTDAENSNLKAGGKFSFRILEDAFYMKLSNVALEGEAVSQIKPLIQIFSNNWYKMSFDKLEALSGEKNMMVQRQEAQKRVIDAYKKLLSENQVLLAENIRKEDGNYLIDVKPNFDLIFTEEFIDNSLRNLVKASLPEDKADEEIFPALDEEQIAQLPQIKETAKQIWEEGQIMFTMKIDKKTHIASSSEMSGNLDLAKLDEILKEFRQELKLDKENEETEKIEEALSGKITFSITSANADINQPQEISVPEGAIDFDPLAMMGIQQPAETDEVEPAENDGAGMPNDQEEIQLDVTPDETQPVTRP